MPDEKPKYYAVLTDAGARLEARALAEGRGVVLTHIAVGDANLQDVIPGADATELAHEVCRRPIEFRSVDKNDPNITLLHAVIPANIGGFWIRELGVVGRLEGDGDDASNPEVLYAYANHAPYYKMLPQDGQTVTHEITVPILQSASARLSIEVSESGYATKAELEAMRREMEVSSLTAAALVELSGNALRMANRIADLELAGTGAIIRAGGGQTGPEGYQVMGNTVAPVCVAPQGETPLPGAAVAIVVETSTQGE